MTWNLSYVSIVRPCHGLKCLLTAALMQLKRACEMKDESKDKASLAEVHERLNNLEPLGMPSVKEFLEFDSDGATREYEKTYLALLDNVRDKTTDEKIAYIKKHVPGLRRQVSLMASTHDMLYTSETDDGLAFILVYRYEHHISIFDDLELEKTREPAEEYLYSNFPDPENGLKPCPALLAPSVLPLKYPSTCHRHSGKGLFDVSGHVFNELADKCLNLLVCYMENSVDAFKQRTHNDL